MELMQFLHVDELRRFGLDIQTRRRITMLYRHTNIVNVFETLAGQSCPTRLLNETDGSWATRLDNWFYLAIQQSSVQEEMLFSETRCGKLREYLSQIPTLKRIVGNVGTDNTDVILNNRKENSVMRIQARQRTFERVPVTLVIYMVSLALANDRSNRQRINRLVSTGFGVPSMLVELCKSTRQSQCGHYLIEPMMKGFSDDIVETLQLEKTCFDINWLLTETGFNMVVELFAVIRNIEVNYINFVEMTTQLGWNSGFETRAMALNFEENSSPRASSLVDVEVTEGDGTKIITTDVFTPVNGDIKLLPGHSYGNAVNGVHVMDTNISHSYLSYDVLGVNKLIIGDFSLDIYSISSNFVVAGYVMRRGSGEIVNRPTSKKDLALARKNGGSEEESETQVSGNGGKGASSDAGSFGKGSPLFKKVKGKGVRTEALGGLTIYQKRSFFNNLWKMIFGGPVPRKLRS